MSVERDLSEKAREKEEQTELSDDGMAMDPEDIPHTANADPDEESTFVPGKGEA